MPGSSFQFAIDDIVWESGGGGATPTPEPGGPTSVSQTSSTMLQLRTTTAGWADVHYTVNNGAQQNVRMQLSGSNNNTYTAGGLKIGDVVRYSFTYRDAQRNFAVDTQQQTHTMQ